MIPALNLMLSALGPRCLTLSTGCYEKDPEHVLGMDVFRSWQNPLVNSLTSRIKATSDTKDRVAILVTALLPHLSGQDSKATIDLRGNCEISATITGLKEAGVCSHSLRLSACCKTRRENPG